MSLRPCINFTSCGSHTSRSRCTACQAEEDRKHNDHSYYASPAWRRLQRLARRVYRDCAICGSTHRLTMHHRLGRADGGADSVENLVGLCASCHSVYEADVRADRGTELRRLVDAL